MKNISKVLAILVALMLMAAAALAESAAVETYKLTITDPQVYMNGAAMADLTGLSIEGTTYKADGRDMLRLRLLGGDKEALDLYASHDGRWLIAGAKGLSEIYGVPIEKLADQSKEMEQLAGLAGLFSEETLSQVGGVVMNAFMGYMAKIEQSTTTEEPRMIDHAVGQIEMSGTTITIRAEDVKALGKELEEGLTAIPTVKQLLAFIESQMSSNFDYDLEKGSDIPIELGDISATIWTTDDPNVTRIEMDFSFLNPEDRGESIDFHFVSDTYLGENNVHTQEIYATGTSDGKVILEEEGVSYVHSTDAGSAFEYTLGVRALVDDTMQDVMNMEAYYYPIGYTDDNADRAVFGLRADVSMDEDEGTQSVAADGYYAPAGGDYNYDEIAFNLYGGNAAENFTFELLAQNQRADGNEYYGAQVTIGENDDLMSFYYTFEGQYAPNAFGGEDRKGQLTVGGGIEGQAFDLVLGVEIEHAAVDASQLPTIDGTPLNVMTLGEKDMDLVMAEGQALLLRLQSTLATTVPGLMSLLSSGMF